ncbi:site-specific DNA recombinase [Mucilaginibacter sp. UYNi724]
MKTANLYIRVSTDEQADKGYSQRNQDEMLHKYCQLNGIQAKEVIYEDHSAKTFNRPAWNLMLNKIKKNKKLVPDLILFTKWDRFSRNAGDAYQMIGLLRSYGIEPQAIEQPLDPSIPENKMMMAFYLAAPEVENDRRALNIFHGIRRAKKEGRWTSSAPMGYANKTTEDGRKYIAIKEPLAGIMKSAFEELATGKYATEQVWKQARRNGLPCGRNNFWNLIRNPIYCGKIVVPAYKDEPMRWADGQHEPIITGDLFNKVQLVLNRKKRNRTTKIVSHEYLPLRGFLVCPKCGKMLTGSASKGMYGYYHYYHCYAACGVRFRAGDINEQLLADLSRYKLIVNITDLFKKIARGTFKEATAFKRLEVNRWSKRSEDLENRIVRAKELLLAGELDGSEYRSIKTEAETKITLLKEALAKNTDPMEPVNLLLKKHAGRLLNPVFLYERANMENKRKLLHFLFPAKLIYDKPVFHNLPKKAGKVYRLQ